MDACGLVVEYNPFHNGHLHHVQEARKVSGTEIIICVMSGNFLQRGEPAIIDKFHRTRAALASGADLVLELPFTYAVESSEWFARGSVATLAAAGVSSICFGSESGEADSFKKSYDLRKERETEYQEMFRSKMDQGLSFPEANKAAYTAIGLDRDALDLTQPNNILGFSYVREIIERHPNIKPLTIKRTQSGYHDPEVTGRIASATSIRKQLLADGKLTEKTKKAITEQSATQLILYKEAAGFWHSWENYFPLLHYKVSVSSAEELSLYHGVEEGLENRIKKTAATARNMNEWIAAIKTKRYTWTRLQRAFVHILANVTKEEILISHSRLATPYLRILGMNSNGRLYLNRIKKSLDRPLITRVHERPILELEIEERAAQAYYSILSPEQRTSLYRQEMLGPVIAD
ncbi:nucleotidyltransferase [Aciduricibacillus chroicocephali]|uniref:tRNA(Met) cytidine acetate ligase n=1 Tax=Aciduricibacillus chroicocephali TaxID=3054939 RepID=A0ABY9KYG2_9BACI|nr:nucleotidyltransferase [Bacillaceae bacterium 44XB]